MIVTSGSRSSTRWRRSRSTHRLTREQFSGSGTSLETHPTKGKEWIPKRSMRCGDDLKLTSHSCRVTLLDAAVHAGRSTEEIGLQANWKNPRSIGAQVHAQQNSGAGSDDQTARSGASLDRSPSPWRQGYLAHRCCWSRFRCSWVLYQKPRFGKSLRAPLSCHSSGRLFLDRMWES